MKLLFRENVLFILLVMIKLPSFTSDDQKRFKLLSCQNVCDILTYILDNIFIRFGTKLHRQILGIPMGANCAPFVADLFYFAMNEIS